MGQFKSSVDQLSDIFANGPHSYLLLFLASVASSSNSSRGLNEEEKESAKVILHPGFRNPILLSDQLLAEENLSPASALLILCVSAKQEFF